MPDPSDVESLTTQDLQARMAAHPSGTFVARKSSPYPVLI